MIKVSFSKLFLFTVLWRPNTFTKAVAFGMLLLKGISAAAPQEGVSPICHSNFQS